MQDVLIAPVRKEKLQKSAISAADLPSIQWPIVGVQSLNGNGPHTDILGQTEDRADVQDDPYRYGWRYVPYAAEDGQEEFKRVPLTAYDLLHPQEGDFIVETTPHSKNIQYASIVIQNQVKGRPGAFVFSDLRTDLDLPNVEPIGPDVSVFLDVEKEKDWATFYCALENAYPTLVIEVTSPSTRNNDFDPKYEFYRRAGVLFYVILDIIYDKDDQVLGYQLFPFELVNGGYVEISSDSEDRYWIPPLSIALGINEDGIVCYDAAGNLLLDYDQLDDALAEERDRHEQTAQALSDSIDRVNAETQRAAKQERLAQQEAARAAEQERLAQQEAARAAEQERLAQQEAARATEQERLAQQEAARAAQAEDEVARLRALVAQLGGEA